MPLRRGDAVTRRCFCYCIQDRRKGLCELISKTKKPTAVPQAFSYHYLWTLLHVEVVIISPQVPTLVLLGQCAAAALTCVYNY